MGKEHLQFRRVFIDSSSAADRVEGPICIFLFPEYVIRHFHSIIQETEAKI